MRFLKLVSTLLLIVVLAACSTSASSGSTTNGSDYPSRTINITIPYAAGGSGDLQARIIAEFLQKELKQTVNVISKPGGAGSIGMNAVKSSKADGYNIILTAVGPSTLTPNSNDVGYNVTEDFEQIAQISEAPYGIAVNESSTIKSLDELLDQAKNNPKSVTYGTTGAGLHQHVVTSAFLATLDGVEMEHIPFEGGAEAVSALLGNHTTASVNTVSEIIPHNGNGLRILAVTSEERLEDLPEVPTFGELGYELISNGAWFGFMAPKGTPEEIITTLDEAIKKALEDEEIIAQFKNAGLPIRYLNSQDFKTKVEQENVKNAEVIQSLK